MKKIKRLKMVSFLANIEDVTDMVNSAIPLSLDDDEKKRQINDLLVNIKDSFMNKIHLDEKVYSIHLNNRYYIYVLKFIWIYR